MQVNSSSNQQDVSAATLDDQGGTRGNQNVQKPAQPAVHDTSKDVPTQGAGAGIPGFVPNKTPPPNQNVGTVYTGDSKQNSKYAGYYPAPKSNPPSAQTPLDVFGRGFKDGATHPGQTFGKISDMSSGNTSGTGEQAGKKVDDILKQLPVVGDALGITQGIAGEKNPDGTPALPAPPNVSPDESESVNPGAPQNHGAANAPSAKAPAPEGGASPTPLKKPASGPEGSAAKAPTAEKGTEPVPSDTATSAAKGSNNQPAPSDKSPAIEATSGATETHAPDASASASRPKLDIPNDYAYASEPKGNLQADPGSPGVFTDGKGQTYIQANDLDIPVRYDKDNGTWRAYRPDDPAKPQYPVQLDKQGNWQVHNDVGLKGGAPGGGEASGNNMTNRDRLAQTATQSPQGNTPGAYPASVNVVNDMLKRMGINLSDQSAETIMNNIKQVDAGKLSHASASAREVWTFARDVNDASLPMKDRAAAAFGMVLNGIAAPAYHAQFDLQNYHFGTNQDADLRRAMQMYIQFEPHA